jgi:outer membrane biosynthesis protein TonB
MQLPRVIIAAVFFVIGLLIAVPALLRTTSSSSDASESPSPGNGSTALATESPSGSPSGSPRRSASPTRTATKSPSPTRTPTPTKPPAEPTTKPTTKPPTKPPAGPTTKPPTKPPAGPTTTQPSTPSQPLRVTVGRVDCPGRTVEVTVRNTGTATQDYTVETNDGATPKGDRIGAGQTRTTRLTLRENRRTKVTVTWRNEPVEQAARTADCRRAPVNGPPDDELPNTGADSGVLWARAITGLAAMITGVIVFWYGGIWPRRREQIFAKKDASG